MIAPPKSDSLLLLLLLLLLLQCARRVYVVFLSLVYLSVIDGCDLCNK